MRRISQNSFENCPNILTIDFSWNQIQEIPARAFRFCRYLATLNLASNQITDGGISRESFEGLSSLRHLRLGNNLTAIRREIFEHIPNLESLSLLGNRGFRTIQGGTFPNSLLTLTLSFSGIQELPADAFQGLCLP